MSEATREAGGVISEQQPSDRCPICRSDEAPRRYEFREMLFGTRETFAYLGCVGCGALRIAEPPADLARHYPAVYYGDPAPAEVAIASETGLRAAAGAARDRARLFGTGRAMARAMRHWAPPIAPEVRRLAPFTRRAGLTSFDDPILDVGCGRQARNLVRLRSVGFRRLLGIDPFLDSDGEYRGVPLRRQSVVDTTGSFRAITFHHSFEHVSDPEATLAAAVRCLQPDGVILIRTPVMDSWFWERFGADWWELDAPRHLWVHTQASLERLAAAVGLALIDVVWDSTYVEMIASEQIARDIAWHEPTSWNVQPPAGYDEATIASLRSKAAGLNASGRAGRAGFYFRRAPGAGRAHAASHAGPA